MADGAYLMVWDSGSCSWVKALDSVFIKPVYPPSFDIPIPVASLASDTNLLSGSESSGVNSVASDYLLSGKFTTGTSPTSTRSIEVWAVGSWNGTLWPDVFDGVQSSGTTITSANHKASICRYVASMSTDTTSNRTYNFGPVSMSDVFRGTIPPKFSIFVTHNTAVNLNSTSGNHQLCLQPVYETVTQ